MGKKLFVNGMKPEDVAEVWVMHAPEGSGKQSIEVGYKMGEGPLRLSDIPAWMTKLKRTWDSPSEPVKFEFTLLSDEYAQEALNYLYNEPVTREL